MFAKPGWRALQIKTLSLKGYFAVIKESEQNIAQLLGDDDFMTGPKNVTLADYQVKPRHL